jgi:hypothetical protein
MVLQLDIPISTVTTLSMLVLGLSLFRISLLMKWPFLVLASLFLSCASALMTTLQAQMLNPMLMIFMQAVLVHYLFRVRKLHSLMVAFLGSLGYTIYLAIVLFLAPFLTHISVNDYFYGVYPSHRVLKLIAALFSFLTSYVLFQKRLGFTVQMELPAKASRRHQNNALLIVFLSAFALFSSTYYAVTQHMASIFYFAASFCVLLAWIIYLLYKKEMDES